MTPSPGRDLLVGAHEPDGENEQRSADTKVNFTCPDAAGSKAGGHRKRLSPSAFAS